MSDFWKGYHKGKNDNFPFHGTGSQPDTPDLNHYISKENPYYDKVMEWERNNRTIKDAAKEAAASWNKSNSKGQGFFSKEFMSGFGKKDTSTGKYYEDVLRDVMAKGIKQSDRRVRIGEDARIGIIKRSGQVIIDHTGQQFTASAYCIKPCELALTFSDPYYGDIDQAEIYMIFASKQAPIYVGKSVDVIGRVLTHLDNSNVYRVKRFISHNRDEIDSLYIMLFRISKPINLETWQNDEVICSEFLLSRTLNPLCNSESFVNVKDRDSIILPDNLSMPNWK